MKHSWHGLVSLVVAALFAGTALFMVGCATESSATSEEKSNSKTTTQVAARSDQSPDGSHNAKNTVCRTKDCPSCVVHLKMLSNGQQYATGSGVLIDGNRVLTAAHLFATISSNRGDVRPDQLHVVFPARASGGKATEDIEVSSASWVVSDSDLRIAIDELGGEKTYVGRQRSNCPPNGDFAIIYLSNREVPSWAPPASVARSAPSIGDWVISVGLEDPDEVRVHTAKLIEPDPEHPESGRDAYLMIGVRIQQGDSGGPLFNAEGEVVGVNSGGIEMKATHPGWIRTNGNSIDFKLPTTHEHHASWCGGGWPLFKFLDAHPAR